MTRTLSNTPATERLRAGWYALRTALAPRVEDAARRAIDVVLAGSALLLLSPILATIAIAIRLGDPGPVFFVQDRVGRKGRTFPFPKFRTMYVGADRILEELREQNDHADSITFKSKNDPRITPVGRLLRRTSLDEIPQLWSVLVGDMTLVGPRPALPSEVALYSWRDRRRLDAAPGITCIWQVSGRGDIPFDQQLEMDLEYIRTRTLLGDLALLLRTVPAVVLGRGAY